MKSVSLLASCALAAFVASACGAQAAVLSLSNASFEETPLTDGAYRAGGVNGWTNSGGNVGWQNPTTQLFANVPDGAQTGWIGTQKDLYAPGVLGQTAAASVGANTRYVLTADVGRRFDVPLAAFIVEILVGGQVVSSGGFGAADIDPGAFRTLSMSYDATEALSQPLSFRFRVTEESSVYSQVNFDNVAMEATSLSSAVPEPATWAMMIAGFGLAGSALRSRRALIALP